MNQYRCRVIENCMVCRESHFSNNRNKWFCNHDSLDAWSNEIKDTIVIPDWCPLPIYQRDMPSSKELIEMADTEWKNREERKGIHDEVSWTSGWISGFLTTNNVIKSPKLVVDQYPSVVMKGTTTIRQISRKELGEMKKNTTTKTMKELRQQAGDRK